MRPRYTCRRLHVDQIISDTDEMIAAWQAEETGFDTMRAVKVRKVVRFVVETLDALDPRQVNAYESESEAMEAAREVLSEPDSRGIYRGWVVDDGEPGGESSMGPGAWLG